MNLHHNFIHTDKPANGQDVFNMLGPMSKEALAAILYTRANEDEISQAMQYLDEDYFIQSVRPKAMSKRIRQIYDILDYERNRSEP